MKNESLTLYDEIRNSFDFLEAEKHDDWLCDYIGNPIPSVSEETFNKYIIFIFHLIRNFEHELPINVVLCSNKTIDLEFSTGSPRLLINIKESSISYYGYGLSTPLGLYHDEIKGESTSEIPDQELIEWMKKYYK